MTRKRKKTFVKKRINTDPGFKALDPKLLKKYTVHRFEEDRILILKEMLGMKE